VLVTGAAGGLGQALLSALEELGARAVGIDRSNISTPGRQLFISADLTDSDAVKAAVEASADHLGGIDAVIGAAAIVDTIHRAAEFPDAAFRIDLDVNLIAQFTLARAAYPHLRLADSPSIVFISSQAGLDGLPGQAAYATAKAGLIGLTTSLAAEWVRDGIRVNAVAPGLFDTPKVVAMPSPARERMLTGVPMARSGSLAEIVGPILFLLSAASGYMTGRTLRLDGGAGLALSGLFR
jgi:NAD(P)-dependent dehydrogenase (short-subunit alcohol dehydrogenase family)